ncbi:hypothetical protein [Lentiprolixibacter aurantiacus]|uniref:Uncharacterized protein n=1 Tax=Lentiprolixibacter aurantiacus TaxID=2993939 RepID=A0AAE3MNJ5_9FLAO|nr:hypothetical protein [Lentiprolixibacter aurantiacus]MCX2720694.1 hypothetical protein [Lentiprolixibacter aurantiacus]
MPLSKSWFLKRKTVIATFEITDATSGDSLIAFTVELHVKS